MLTHSALRGAARSRRAPTTLTETVSAVGLTNGVANVVMQLSLAGVGEGVSESRVVSGSPRRYPVKRGRTTAQYLAVAIGGSETDRATLRTAIAEVHRHVRSGADSLVRYSGNSADLQLWVALCLFRFFLQQHELLYGELSEPERDVLVAGADVLATGVNVKASAWPRTWAAYDALWREMLLRLSVSPQVRADLSSLADLTSLREAWGPFGSVLALLFGRQLNLLTRGHLEPEFRELMGWCWSSRDQRRYDRALRVLRLADRLGLGTLLRGYNRLLVADLRIRHRLGLPVLGRLRVAPTMIRDGAGTRWWVRLLARR